MAEELRDVKGEYVFFAAYMEKASEQENWDVNGMLNPQTLRRSQAPVRPAADQGDRRNA